jgi:hypothetical protein
MVILGPAKGPEERPAKRNVINIITICNYDIYQTSLEILDAMEASERASTGASEGPARGHTVTREQGKQEEERSDDLLSSGDGQSDGKMTASKAAKIAFDLYNETAARCGLSVCRILNESRKRSLALRVKEAGGIDGFKQALANLERSAYCRGQNADGWRANIDYVCQPKGFAKLFEGGWGNGAHGLAKDGHLDTSDIPKTMPRPRSEARDWHEKQDAALAYIFRKEPASG